MFFRCVFLTRRIAVHSLFAVALTLTHWFIVSLALFPPRYLVPSVSLLSVLTQYAQFRVTEPYLFK